MRNMLITFFIAILGCSESKNTDLAMEMAARSMGEQARQLEMVERPVEAAKIFGELRKKYEGTKYYAQLEAEMEQFGISIKEPLVSHTSKRMFKLQNLILSYKKSKQSYPRGHVISIPDDMWGNKLSYEISDSEDETKSYEFLVFSKGGDGKKNTDDDLYLIYAGNRSANMKAKKSDQKKNEPQTKRVSSSQVPPETLGFSGKAVNLERLGKMLKKETPMAGGASGKERKVSLEELKKMNKKQPGRSREKEVKVTLEELLSGEFQQSEAP